MKDRSIAARKLYYSSIEHTGIEHRKKGATSTSTHCLQRSWIMDEEGINNNNNNMNEDDSSSKKRPAAADDDSNDKNQNGNEAGPPPAKRLRSCENDLKIIVGRPTATATATATATSDPTPPPPREFWCVSNVMAYHSNFFDTLLATPMQESISREIHLPDVDPNDWEKVMRYLNPCEGLKFLTLEDVIVIAPLYDKYEFRQGKELCDYFVAAHFQKELHYLLLQEQENAPQGRRERMSLELDLLIEAFAVTQSCHFSEATITACFDFFSRLFSDKWSTYGRMMFHAQQLQKLVPLFRKVEKQKRPPAGLPSKLLGAGGSQLGVLSANNNEEDFSENPIAGELLMVKYQRDKAFRLLMDTCPIVRIRNCSEPNINGIYYQTGLNKKTRQYMRRSSAPLSIRGVLYDELALVVLNEPLLEQLGQGIHHHHHGWAICGIQNSREFPPADATKTPLWYVPSSASQPLPPEQGWIEAAAPAAPVLPRQFGDRSTMTAPTLTYQWLGPGWAAAGEGHTTAQQQDRLLLGYVQQALNERPRHL